MSDLHEVHFKWPSTEPSVVIVTGTFDEWSSSVYLSKTENGFTGTINIPFDTKIYYKYVVDSNWVCETTSPTETDSSGNVNNVYFSPPKPVAVEAAVADPVVITDALPENLESSTPAVADPPSETKSADHVDFAETVVAAEGTSSALGYVASALGAAIQSQIGMDPINGEKVNCCRNPKTRCRVQCT
ncbi:hypothetical protein C8R45DRAFT_235494 [Mycena sanguinolenta]|nr:hypothetical protein C8R45DRAFT_235494 [Mycena sanguinolenta]